AGARGLGYTLARTLAAALLARHAVAVIGENGERRPSLALLRFIARGLTDLSATEKMPAVDLLDPPSN
ncbi:MAG: acyl-CoA dehydrogenase, partial [Dokdonella sp.]